MSDIIGSILTVKNLLAAEKAEIFPPSVSPEETKPTLTLAADRIYVIPAYQREIRWDNQIMELITDIELANKFLGNIILHYPVRNSKYEIVDGQQRITCLLIILKYLESQGLTFPKCILEIKNFPKYKILYDNNFRVSDVTISDQINKEDHYRQRQRYEKLYTRVEKYFSTKDRQSVNTFYDNLCESQINVIVSTSTRNNIGISHFLDVNLKGIKLDTEDIFKSYFFKLDNVSQPFQDAWVNLKFHFEILDNKLSGTYPLTTLIEHNLWCVLYENTDYREISFNEQFKLTNDISSQILGVRYKEEHIIPVIGNKSFFLNCITELTQYISFINSIITSTGVNDEFKKFFNCKNKLDSDFYELIHSLIKSIILGKDLMPKALIMKFFLSVFLGTDKKDKEEYYKFFGVYLYCILFSIFESSKGKEKIDAIIRENEWYETLIVRLKKFFDEPDFTAKKLRSRYSVLYPNNDNQYLAKSLAAIYNYFEINTSSGNIEVTNQKNLRIFLENKSKYSTEHFLVNNSKQYKIKAGMTEKDIQYSSDIYKLKDSIFNFLFIDSDTNEFVLKNYSIANKVSLLKTIKIDCEYSNMVFDIIQETINVPDISEKTICEAESILNSYLNGIFAEEYTILAKKIVEAVADKLRIKKHYESKNKLWERAESMLLVELYDRLTKDNTLDKNTEYKKLSTRLRDYAKKNGVSVSESYRNVAGIKMKMANIKFALTGKGLSAVSKLDNEIVLLYKEKPKDFFSELKTLSISANY